MTRPLWTYSEILRALRPGGIVTETPVPETERNAASNEAVFGDKNGGVFGISIDSREVFDGDLFVALPGAKTDGANFVRQAFANGATLTVVSKLPTGIKKGEPRLIRVPDTLEALRTLAKAARERTKAKVIAVTGSAGKTGVREAIYQALSLYRPTHTSERSFNNHVGVPLSLARLPREAEFAVFEIGMNAPGEIAPLARLIRPDGAVVTAIGSAHLGAFESEAAIAREKAAIFRGVKKGGFAVIPLDSPHYQILRTEAEKAGISRIYTYSIESRRADAAALKRVMHESCSCVSANVLDTGMTFKVATPGRHWVSNALATLAAVRAVGGDLGLAGVALASLAPQPGRGAVFTVETARGAFRVVDESYNANPASFRAALDVFAMMKPASRKGRKLGVFADMEELGESSRDQHLALAGAVKAAGLDTLYVRGKGMAALLNSLKPAVRGFVFSETQGIFRKLKQDLRRGDLVLVKGSRTARLDEVVESLRCLAEAKPITGWGAPLQAAE